MPSMDETVADPLTPDRLTALRARLESLKQAVLDVEAIAEDEIALVHPDRRVGARNLVDYLAIRQHDLRALQRELYAMGLSSMGVVHRHVMASIEAALRIVDRLAGHNREL